MKFYYMLEPMMAVITALSAFFLAGLIIGAIIGRTAGKRRMWRVLASKYNMTLATLTERTKQESRLIRRLEDQLHAQKCKNAQVAAMIGKIAMEVTE